VSFWRKRRDRAACAEARDAELLGAADAATLARVSRHLVKCAACQAERGRLEALRADVRTDPAPLDDLTRARILDRLIPALDDLASGRAHAPPRRKPGRLAVRWLPVAGAAAAASVLAVVLWPAAIYWHARLSGGSPGFDGSGLASPVAATGPSPAAGRAPAPVAMAEPPLPGHPSPATPAAPPAGSATSGRPATPPAAEPPAADPLALIQPEPAVAGPSGDLGTVDPTAKATGRAAGAAGRDRGAAEPAVRRWVLAEGMRRRARLGERTQLLLVGPAELEVVSASPDLLEVRLARGTMVGDYRHGPRGRLRILSPGTRTDVVGTTFYVEAQAEHSRVAVGHGRVLVRAGDRRGHLVSAGQVWSSGSPLASPGSGGRAGSLEAARGSNRPSRLAARATARGGRTEGAIAPLPRDIARLFAEQAGTSSPRQRYGARQSAAERGTASPVQPAPRSPAGKQRPRLARSPGQWVPPTAAAERGPLDGPPGPPAAPGHLDPGEQRPPAPAIAAPEPTVPAAGQVGATASNAVHEAPPAGNAGPAAATSAGAAATPAERPEQPGQAPGDSTATDLYQRAERAMGRGDQAEARRWLLELAALPAAGALGPVASYELAQLALRTGDLEEARARLERVRGSGASDLAEPAAFLACEVELRAGALEDARRCYRRFRARHPDSVQDAEALGALLRLSPVTADCGAGRALLDEYLARHPAGPLAAEAKTRRRACEP
jgi:ferric-dicitrate binding protein FerR (iron transport regulator)